MTTPEAVIITKPGYDTVRIGPIHFHHQAESWIRALNMCRHSTVMPEGTTWEIAPYDPAVPHDDPAQIPTTPAELGVAIAQIDRIGEAEFPDLFVRLQAVIGTDEAMRLWDQGCSYAEGPFDGDEVDE